MSQRGLVQQLAESSPLGQVLIQDREEPVVVVSFQQVGHFVDDDVFEAFRWLLGEFQIEPDASGRGIAGAPFGFHAFDAPVGDLDAQDRLPLLDQGRYQGLQSLAIPALQDTLTLFGVGVRPDNQRRIFCRC